MGALTLRLSDEELKAFKEYAELCGETVSGVVRKTMLEKLEDEFDYRTGMQALQEFYAGDQKTITLDELRKKLDI